MKQPKQLKDWALSPEAKRVVKKEIRAWIKLFTEHAEGRQGTVRHLDFINNDVFFFTDCKDIQDSQDLNERIKISNRKRNVMHQLILKYLIGDKIIIDEPKCYRCRPDHIVTLKSIGVGKTYMTICPRCNNLILRGDACNFPFNASAVMKWAEEGKLKKYNL